MKAKQALFVVLNNDFSPGVRSPPPTATGSCTILLPPPAPGPGGQTQEREVSIHRKLAEAWWDLSLATLGGGDTSRRFKKGGFYEVIRRTESVSESRLS